MKIFYDCEFLEDGRTIDLISIGMVREDGQEYYAVNRDLPVKAISKHTWLMANVVPSLPRLFGEERMAVRRTNPLGLNWQHPAIKPRSHIADEVRDFIRATPDVELWAWYGAYDHVTLAQLFGSMVDLPRGVPMFTHELHQEIERHGPLPGDVVVRDGAGMHNALEDARHVRRIAEFLGLTKAGR